MEKEQLDIQHHPNDPYEDEIELMDYLKVLWKWKYLILIGTLVCVIGAAVVSLNMTKVYSVNTVVQPGMLKVTDDGKTTYIASVGDIKALVDTKAFNGEVTKGVKLPGMEEGPNTANFETTVPKGSNALSISYETPYPDVGLQIEKNLIDALLARYGKLMAQFKKQYGMDILAKEAEIARLEEEINGVRNTIHTTEAKYKVIMVENANSISSISAKIEADKNQVKSLEQKMVDLESEISRIAKNTNLLSGDRNKYLSSSTSRDNILASLIYTNTIQQNISLLNTFRNEMNGARERIYGKRAGIKGLEGDIKGPDC